FFLSLDTSKSPHSHRLTRQSLTLPNRSNSRLNEQQVAEIVGQFAPRQRPITPLSRAHRCPTVGFPGPSQVRKDRGDLPIFQALRRTRSWRLVRVYLPLCPQSASGASLPRPKGLRPILRTRFRVLRAAGQGRAR